MVDISFGRGRNLHIDATLSQWSRLVLEAGRGALRVAVRARRLGSNRSFSQ